MAQTSSNTPGNVLASNVAVSVAATGNTEILDIITNGISELGIEIAVTVQALDAFIVQGRMSPNGTYQTLYSAAGDFTTPAGLVIDASGDLTVQAAASSGWLLLNVAPLYSVKILASANAAGAATVTAYAIGK